MAKERRRIPNQLKRYRKLNKFRQKDIAEILHSRSTSKLSEYEKGNILPSFTTVLKLSALYGTIPQELYRDYAHSISSQVRASKREFYKRKAKQPKFYDDS